MSFKIIIMTTSMTRPCFTTQQQTCKTKTDVFFVSDRSCPKTDGVRPHHRCNHTESRATVWKTRSRPGGGSERRDPRLKHAVEEDSRVLPGDDEVKDGQRADSVYDQTGDDCDHVQAELLGCSRQIFDVQDLPRDQTHDAQRGIPARQPSTLVNQAFESNLSFLIRLTKYRISYSKVEGDICRETGDKSWSLNFDVWSKWSIFC